MRYKLFQFFIFASLFSVIVWVWDSPVSFAENAQVGVVGGVHGSVIVVSKDGEARPLQGGSPVYLGDRLNTESNGHLQILFTDETVFTLGPSSSVAVDEFVYDPASHEGKIKASVVKGIFRIVTGKVAHKKPENMTVDLPAGAIGFRGTLVIGKSEGLRSLVVLWDSAGAEGASPGHILVSNTVNGEKVFVDISEKGYGTTIEGANLAPLPAFKVPEGEIDSLMSALSQPVSGEGKNISGGGAGASSGANDMVEALSKMSQLDEYAQKAGQGGMLMPPQAVTVPLLPTGRDEGDDNNN